MWNGDLVKKINKLKHGDKDCDIILWSVVMEEFWIGGSNSLNFEINNIERKFIVEKRIYYPLYHGII
jgi:hypothetical protein